MKFKKDYINYVLHNVLQSESTDNIAVKKLLERVIALDNFFKITFIVGKTAGLELLFKYFLYISDKVDKSQITIFNLKDNFDYDVNNLKRICSKLQLKEISHVQEMDEMKTNGTENPDYRESKYPEGDKKEAIHIEADEGSNLSEEFKDKHEEPGESIEDSEVEDEGMSLIENKEPESFVSGEVFELESINRSIETGDPDTNEKQEMDEAHSKSEYEEDNVGEDTLDENVTEGDSKQKDIFDEEFIDEESIEEEPAIQEESSVIEEIIEQDDDEIFSEEAIAEESELKIEVRKPYKDEDELIGKLEINDTQSPEDEYNKFEHKYYEEIKILEKMFSYIEKECKYNAFKGLNERTIQSFNEIIEISDGLANMTRQLSFDLIADIFLTLNMYFTKAVKDPSIISLERIKLFDSSLTIVSSLIKGENYMDYDEIIAKVEALKEFLARPSIVSGETISQVSIDKKAEQEEIRPLSKLGKMVELQDMEEAVPEEIVIEKPLVKKQSVDSIIFKMKYLVKEFEKNFAALENIKGEYSKFAALEKVDELNSYLRMLAKISAAVKLDDILKLAEVSYVFLKYLKDYRMDLLDSEIQQIIKYIIFTFKMLLTDRKPEDFNVLVQYLNNPVKIFADSN